MRTHARSNSKTQASGPMGGAMQYTPPPVGSSRPMRRAVLAGVGLAVAPFFVMGLVGAASGPSTVKPLGGGFTYRADASLDGSQVAVRPPATFCQFSIDRRGVTVMGWDVQAFKVKLRGLGSVKVDVPNRAGRQWVTLDVPGHAEDDVRRVWARVRGEWERCEPA